MVGDSGVRKHWFLISQFIYKEPVTPIPKKLGHNTTAGREKSGAKRQKERRSRTSGGAAEPKKQKKSE
jgi:hypothetical protein